MNDLFILSEFCSDQPRSSIPERSYLLSSNEYTLKPRSPRGKEIPVRYWNQDSIFNERDYSEFFGKIKKRRFLIQIFPTKQTSSEQVFGESVARESLKQGKISLGRMAELLGLYYSELLEKLITQRIPLNFGPSNLEEAEKEIEILRKYLK